MKRVYLCQPYSHNIEPESMEARVSQNRRDLAIYSPRLQNSLLNFNFNQCVANAKNGRYDYFAMLHSDVQPLPDWLGQMVDGLEERELDIIHAPCAIKNNRGLTSTCLAYSLDPWQRKRKLTVKELLTLPEVFDVDDAKKLIDPNALALLPNTGCLVIKMGQWFYEWRGFRTLDDIIPPDEQSVPRPWESSNVFQYEAVVVSEDWMLGYHAAERGLRVGGTMKVRTRHYGRFAFSTEAPWGQEHDREYFEATRQEQPA